jgi:lysophospholipase L1-like esterase
MNINFLPRSIAMKNIASWATVIFVLATLLCTASTALAISYTPGQTLNPACTPQDATCVVAPSGWTASSTATYTSGTVSIGTTTALALLTIDSTSTLGSIIRLSNASTGGHIYDLLSTGSANTNGAGRLDIFDYTAGAARLSITSSGYVGIGTTSPMANFAVNGSAYLTGNLNVGDAATTRSNLGLGYANANQVSWYNITTWGDSLTAGSEDGTGVSYPNQLAADISGSVVTNEGVGGQTSTQIAVREGGVSTTATVSGGNIPASGSVTVTFPSGYEPVTSQGPSPGEHGTIAGVSGLVTLSGSTYTFNVLNGTTTVSTSGAVPFIPSVGSLNSGTVILWEGRNNSGSVSQVESDIAASVAALPSNRYLILSVENGASEGTGTGTYTNITTINSYLAATYPGHYLDTREYLVQHGLTDAGITPTSQDTTDISNDIPPTSLRADNIHLNDAGYKVVAAQVAKWITSFNSSNEAVVTYPQLATVLGNPTLSGLTIASTTYSVSSGTSTVSNVLSSLLTVASSTASASPGLTVLSSGMVGFGTSTPNSVVQIEGPSNPGGNSFTGTTHLGLFLTSQSFGMSGLDFGGLNSVNPEARIAMTTTSNGSYLQFGTTAGWGSGITNTALIIDYGGRVGIGSTTPYAVLSVKGFGNTTGVNFQTTNSSNGPLVTGLDNGNFGIGTTSPSSLFSVGNSNGINFSTATTTFNSTGGINLNAGCFAYQGTCLSTGGSFSNTLANGGTATTTFSSGGVVFSDGSKLTQKSTFSGIILTAVWVSVPPLRSLHFIS